MADSKVRLVPGTRRNGRSSWLIDFSNSHLVVSPLEPERPSADSKTLSDDLHPSSNNIESDQTSSLATASLHVGERVVFSHDGDPEYGTVKWIGILPECSDLMAGVEFDNAISNNSGWYGRQRLFSAGENRAAFARVVDLERAVDFDRDATDFEDLRKNLLVDFDGAIADTTVWSVNEPTMASEISSTPVDPTIVFETRSRARVHPTTTFKTPSQDRALPLTVPKTTSQERPQPTPVPATSTRNHVVPAAISETPSRGPDSNKAGLAQAAKQNIPVQNYGAMQVGSKVHFIDVTIPGMIPNGIIRWIGQLPGTESLMAGVELEQEEPYWMRCANDGCHNGVHYFWCRPKRGVFVPLFELRAKNPVAK